MEAAAVRIADIGPSARHTLIILFLLSSLVVSRAFAEPVGTAFTYQGRLDQNATPASGAFDFEFALFNVAAGGPTIAIASPQDVAVVDGRFTVELDYTEVPFAAAEAYWVEIRVRPGNSTGGYEVLTPRQRIRPAPYAIHAQTVGAGSIGTAALAAGAVGTAQLAPGAVTGDRIASGTISRDRLAFDAGDVTAVVAGTGLTGGGSAGALTLAIDPATTQARIDDSCGAGMFVQRVNADGSVDCAAAAGSSALLQTLLVPVDEAVSVHLVAHPSIAVLPDGRPVFAYKELRSATVRVALCASPTCAGPREINTVGDTHSVGAPSGGEDDVDIAIGDDGLPVVAYADRARNLVIARCADVACANRQALVADGTGTVGDHVSLAIGEGGRPLVAYQRGGAEPALQLARCDDATCSSAATRTLDGYFAGSLARAAVNRSGFPVIAYEDGSGRVRLLVCADAFCASTAGGQTLGEMRHLDLFVAGDDHPILVTESFSANITLRRCLDPSCGSLETRTLDYDRGDASLPTQPAIAVGPGGTAVVSWLRDGEVRVARCVDVSCGTISKSRVAGIEQAIHVSAAVGADDLPVLAYTDGTRGHPDLRAAKCAFPGCH